MDQVYLCDYGLHATNGALNDGRVGVTLPATRRRYGAAPKLQDHGPGNDREGAGSTRDKVQAQRTC